MNTLPPKAPKPPKIAVAQIIVDRIEGPSPHPGPRTFTTFATANDYLREICESLNPKLPGADKVEFKLLFADGEDYTGRFDAKHPNNRHHEAPNIGEHVREFQEFYAGLRRPIHMTDDEYSNFCSGIDHETKRQSVHFLTTYALIDLPKPEPVTTDDGRQAQSIGDAVSTVAPMADLALGIAIQQTARTLKLMDEEVDRLKAASLPYAEAQTRAMTVRKALGILTTAKKP